MWKIIKEVINKKKCTWNSKQFIWNDHVTVDPRAIANEFNNFLVDTGPTFKIDTGGITHEIKGSSVSLKMGLWGEMTFYPTLKAYLWMSCTLTIENNKLFLWTRCFSRWLKIAVVSPLYKAKNPMYFNNYRPISLLSVSLKVLERRLYNRLRKCINKNNCHIKYHFGFRNNHSTFMARSDSSYGEFSNSFGQW